MIKKLALGIVALTAFAVVAAAQTNYTGNGQTGFGGPVGLGNLSFTDNGTTVTGTLTNGNTTAGLNDAFVIYIDDVSGGFSDTSTFTDTADSNRKGISGFDGTNRSTLTFPTGFQADYAISIIVNPTVATFGGLWTLDNPANFTFDQSVNVTPNNNPSATTYTFSFDLSKIGLSTGGTFNFLSTYLNPTSAFRSNEAIGNHFTNETNGNFGQAAATAVGFSTYTATAVPEPSSVALLGGPAILGAWFFVRRRRA
jgi:hypothetical protein